MSSSVQPSEKIASNWLLTHRGEWLRYPLVVGTDGGGLRITLTDAPDRSPFTEFRPGVVVKGLTREAFDRIACDHLTPLEELLPPLIDAENGCVAILSGLDYGRRSLTSQTTFTYIEL